MRIEYQKTMVLISLLVIFGGLYFSYIFDKEGPRQSIDYAF